MTEVLYYTCIFYLRRYRMTNKDSHECVTVNVPIYYCRIIIVLGGPMFDALRVTMPMNLHPRKRIYQHLFNIYSNYPELSTNELSPHKPGKMWLPMNSDRHE